MATLSALSDPDFRANKAKHLNDVQRQWAVRGAHVPGVDQFKKIDKALEKILGQDRLVNNTLIQVTSNLETLVHETNLSSDEQWWVLRSGFSDIYDTPGARAVNETHNCCIISKAVCRRKPELAFQCRSSKPPVSVPENLASRAPFEHAVELENDISAASCMLDCLKSYLDRDNSDTSGHRLHNYLIGCQGADLNGQPKFNPLSVALDEGKISLAKLLMQYDPGLATEGIICACLATIDRDTDKVEVQVQVLRYLLELRPDLRTQKTLNFATTTQRADLVNLFFRVELFTHEAALTIIKYNLKDLWEIPDIKEAFTSYKTPNGGSPPDLLHLAVFYGCVEIVNHLAETTDGAVQLDKKNNYPLYYNRDGYERAATSRRSSDASTSARTAPERPRLLEPYQEGDRQRAVSVGAGTRDHTSDLELTGPRKLIRTALLKQIIQRCKPSKIYEIASACKETFGETSLDLNALDASRFSFSDLVASLTLPGNSQTDLRQTLEFAPILRYVDIPTLPSRPEDISKEHNDIDRLLEWLSSRGVEKIVELEVLDRLWGSHGQKCISKWLAKFKVSTVNWRCQDFGLAKLDESVKNQLTSLHLYSSGNEAVEDHWFGPNGFESMRKLKSVRIIIVEELMHPKKAVEVEARLKALVLEYSERRLKSLLAGYNERKPKPSVNMRPRGYSDAIIAPGWAPGWKRPTIQIERRRVYEEGERPPTHGLQQIGNLAIQDLDPFLQSYRGIFQKKAIRVAILDNGVMLPDAYNMHAVKKENRENRESGENQEPSTEYRSSIADRIVEGESFVHGNYGRLSSWLVASNPHGTQIANLICATDPGCNILVAKVGEHKNDVSPAAVEKAIRWAIRKNADVISMSFAIYQSTNGLQQAIKEAYDKNIVLIASTHDEGSNANEAYPASYASHTIAIAATNDFGSTLTYTPNEKQFNFRLKGVRVFAGAVPYLVSEERISGSSVATAIAAGLASLILSCHHISGYEEPKRPTWKTELVNYYMKQMVPQDAPARKYVSLKKFADLDKQDLKTTVNAPAKIKEWFVKTKDLKNKPVELSRA